MSKLITRNCGAGEFGIQRVWQLELTQVLMLQPGDKVFSSSRNLSFLPSTDWTGPIRPNKEKVLHPKPTNYRC